MKFASEFDTFVPDPRQLQARTLLPFLLVAYSATCLQNLSDGSVYNVSGVAILNKDVRQFGDLFRILHHFASTGNLMIYIYIL